MSTNLNDAFSIAIANIAKWGDTDVFPFPFENHVFHDRPSETRDLLIGMHKQFAMHLQTQPPNNQVAPSMAGYTGFRWVTQIDPIWNAYLLGLVVSIADDIESARLATEKNHVFSYRYKLDLANARLFEEGGWSAFQKQSLTNASTAQFVLISDISDFYPRIYHHRLENSLDLLGVSGDVPNQIIELLKKFSGGISYGLPIGGPAARLLSELLLNRTDRLLLTDGHRFCRFADDYHIFAMSVAETYRALASLSEKLFRNEGLTLQKGKTRLLTIKEFQASSIFDIDEHDDAKSFLTLSLRFDPYSATADEDYKSLKDQLHTFDIVGMLGRELRKSRVHTALTRKLVRAIGYLDEAPRNAAIMSLLENIQVLAPVFASVMLVIRDVFETLHESTKANVCQRIRQLIVESHYLFDIDINLSYALRVLRKQRNDESETLLSQIYKREVAHFVKRDIMLIMAAWKCNYWISDQRNYFGQMHPWVRRAFLVASFVLGDEGKHWRSGIKKTLTDFERLILEWASDQKSGNPKWEVPI